MRCIHPIITKSGLVVPCGKCELCRSNRRNEWSIRLGIETKYAKRMPLFITLTYADEFLPMAWKKFKDGASSEYEVAYKRYGDIDPDESMRLYVETLYRPDVFRFMREYKRVNELKKDSFHYFGCGEYGDTFGRPHYHLLFFNDEKLQSLFDDDVKSAEDYLQEFWKFGRVHVCQAQYSGIHYVTKYCLKEDIQMLDDLQYKPFTIASKRLGSAFFGSTEGVKLKQRIDYLFDHVDEIYSRVPYLKYDTSFLHSVLYDISHFFPDWITYLDDGRKVILPRFFRKHLLGSFEHFTDNPFWLFDHITKLYESKRYLDEYGDFDDVNKTSYARQSLQAQVEKINTRLINRRRKKPNLKQNEGI